jgi:hypothetical protein
MTNRRRTNRRLRKITFWILVAVLLLASIATSISVWRHWRQDHLDHRLIEAIKLHQTDKALSLLDQGASANAQDAPYGAVPARKLMSDIWARLRGTKPPKEYHPSALMLASIVNIDRHAHVFTMHRDVPLMHALLIHGADPNPSVGPYDGTALDMQIWAGDAEVVKLMLDHGAQPNRKIRECPLLEAVLSDRVDIARLLLEHGADVRARTTITDRAWSPYMPVGTTVLHHTASKSRPNRIQMVDLLLSYGAEINAQDAEGRTPLMWASIEAGQDIVPCLLRHGANASLRAKHGETAFYLVKCWPDSPDKRAVARLLRQADAAKGTNPRWPTPPGIFVSGSSTETHSKRSHDQ